MAHSEVESTSLLASVFGLVASVGMIFGGIAPYIPQYLEIHRTESTEGFSLFVCLVLLIANILRIFFWFGKQFETPLLLQSIFMIAAMFAMIEICVRAKNKLPPGKSHFDASEIHRFWDFDEKYFWNWTEFSSFIEFISLFTIIVGLLMYLFINNPYFVETIGYAAMLTEAFLATPQLILNYKKGSTEGLSKVMVLLWTTGDTYNTTYFILNKSPIQFVVCGLLQLTIDFLVALQILFYNLPT